jgi:hypothetical protein
MARLRIGIGIAHHGDVETRRRVDGETERVWDREKVTGLYP